MYNFINKPFSVLLGGVFIAFTLCCFFSCQKATPIPYSNPGTEMPHTITPPTFSAEINGPTVTYFTPIKSIQGSNVILKGVSPYYTITFSFPATLGPGSYFTGSNNIRITVSDGTNTYVNNANVKNAGEFDISSINQGKYNADFTFFASDSTNISNMIDVSQGSITNL